MPDDRFNIPESSGSHEESTDWALLARFVAGECTPAEVTQVERWLAADPSRQEDLAQARLIWSNAADLPSATRIDAMWTDLRAELRRGERDVMAAGVHEPGGRRSFTVIAGRQSSRASKWVWGSFAAAAVILFAVALERGWMSRPTPAPNATSPAAPFMREYATARGERGSVEFSDGTRVRLGVDTKIRVSLHESGRREVHLEGEAFFSVVHDESRPFFVYTRDAVTEDIGTEFVVRAYPGDRTVSVAVNEGKVALRRARPRTAGDTASVVLGPRDLGVVEGDDAIDVRRGIDVDAQLGSTGTRLVLRQATMTEVAALLERWYDVDVEVADPAIAMRRVTLDLVPASLEAALDAATVPLRLQHVRVGRRVTILPASAAR